MMTSNKNLFLMLVLAAMLPMVACSSSNNKKTDDVQKKIEESQRQKFAKVLNLDVDAIDSFDQATMILEQPAPDLAKAEELLQASLKASPGFLEALYNLGVVQEKRSRYSEAIATYTKAMDEDKLNTHTVKFLLAIGRAQALDGQGEAAVKTFEEVQRLDPENLDILNSLASAYLAAGKKEEALDYVKRVLKEDNENLSALNTLAQVYTQQDNRSMAVYVFKKAARIALGGVLSDEDLATEPAMLVLKDRYDKKKVKPEVSADMLNNLGLIYMKMDNTPLAVFSFNAASKLDSKDVESRLNVGALYLRYLNYEGAKAQFEEVLKSAPSNCVAMLGLSASQYALSDQDNAVAGFQRYLEQCDAKSPAAHIQLVRLFERKQDFEKAQGHCDSFVANGGKDETVNGDYCKALGNMSKMQRDNPMGAEGDGTMPAEGEDGMMPAEGEDGMMPAEGDEIPAEGEEIPAEGEEVPAEGAEAPAEEAKPAEAAPAEAAPAEEKPADAPK